MNKKMTKREMVEAARTVLDGMMTEVIRKETQIEVEVGVQNGTDGYFAKCPICGEEHFLTFYQYEFDCCNRTFSRRHKSVRETHTKIDGDTIYYIIGMTSLCDGEVTIPSPYTMGCLNTSTGFYHFWTKRRICDKDFKSKTEVEKFPVPEYDKKYQELRAKNNERKKEKGKSAKTIACELPQAIKA